MIPIKKVEEIISKHKELEKLLSSGEINPKEYAAKSKEYSELNSIISTAKTYLNFEKEKQGLNEIINDSNSDKEMIELSKKELSDFKFKFYRSREKN